MTVVVEVEVWCVAKAAVLRCTDRTVDSRFEGLFQRLDACPSRVWPLEIFNFEIRTIIFYNTVCCTRYISLYLFIITLGPKSNCFKSMFE